MLVLGSHSHWSYPSEPFTVLEPQNLGDWNLSELEFVRIHFNQNWNLSEFIFTQNWNLSESEFVRIGIFQNRNLSELEFVKIGICQN